MKILALLGLLVLLTTSPMTNCIPGQFQPPPIPYLLPVPVSRFQSGVGSIFGFLDCLSGYTLYSTNCGQFCYRLDAQNCKSWDNARAACQADGGDLLEPDTCSYPFFQRLAKQKAAMCNDVWIGGSRTPPSTNYMTVRGASLPDNFKFWGPGQPSRTGSMGGVQACVQMANEFGYLMNDDGCNELAGYICQKLA